MVAACVENAEKETSFWCIEVEPFRPEKGRKSQRNLKKNRKRNGRNGKTWNELR